MEAIVDNDNVRWAVNGEYEPEEYWEVTDPGRSTTMSSPGLERSRRVKGPHDADSIARHIIRLLRRSSSRQGQLQAAMKRLAEAHESASARTIRKLRLAASDSSIPVLRRAALVRVLVQVFGPIRPRVAIQISLDAREPEIVLNVLDAIDDFVDQGHKSLAVELLRPHLIDDDEQVQEEVQEIAGRLASITNHRRS